MTALDKKGAGAFELADGTSASLAQVQFAINAYYRDRFDRASARVLVNAAAANQLAVWNGLVAELSHRLHHLQLLEANWPDGPDYQRPNRWWEHRTRVKDCREAVAEAIGNCTRMGLALITAVSRLRPLPPEGAEIWKLLAGKVLSATELAKTLDRDETTIRKTIQRMRRDGRMISNVGQRGYFRPDAPPADSVFGESRAPTHGSQTSH
ncbi:MAG: HTH domain-containing protein [Planctomycetes bacterium]|nr:HTH domain-containing protein [Planctomycetota bacterium]